jgi:sulfur carrier protein ThiS adenylyltransferase
MSTFNQIKTILSNKRVGIAGAGGLGSNCAAFLVRSGIGKLIIADFDQVSEFNLNRQFYFKHQIGMDKVEALRDNLLMINPDVVLQMHKTKVNKENIPLLFQVCDVIVEAFDHASEKQMFIESVLSRFPDKPLVAASGMAGYGNFSDIGWMESGNFFVCGDFSRAISDEVPPLAPRVNIIAAMQADKVIELLMQSNEKV